MRRVRPEIIRSLVQAAREQRRVEVDYVSLSQPDREGRIIVPHTRVYTGIRWHVRAFCEKNQTYRDFVLSRFRGEPEIMDRSEHGCAADTAWQSEVTVRLKPDPRLDKVRRNIIAEAVPLQNARFMTEEPL